MLRQMIHKKLHKSKQIIKRWAQAKNGHQLTKTDRRVKIK